MLHLWPGQSGEHPKMEAIITRLNDALSPTGLPKSLQREVNEATAGMEDERRRYLGTVTLYDELFAALSNPKAKENGAQTGNSRELEKRFAGDFLAAVEAAELVNLPTAAETETPSAGALFGITDEVYDQSVLATYSERKEMMVQGLLPKIEGKLRDKCDRMVAFAQPDEEENFVCGMGASVTQNLEALIKSQRSEKEGIVIAEEDIKSMEQHHVKILGEYLTELEEYLTVARLKSQYNWDRSNAQYLLMQVSTLGLQLQELETRLTADTYTSDKVAALRKIRDRLVVKQTEFQLQCDQINAKITQFSAAGPAFRNTVDEYVEVEAEARRIRADIEFLKSNVPAPTVA